MREAGNLGGKGDQPTGGEGGAPADQAGAPAGTAKAGAAPTDDGGTGEDDAGAPGAAAAAPKGAAGGTEKPDPGTKGEEAGTTGRAGAGAAAPRYVIRDAQGSEYEVEPLPEGTSIEFKAMGKVVRARSLDEVVELAQKGALARQIESKAAKTEHRLSQQLTALEQKLVDAEAMFARLATDDEALEEFRQRAEKLKDPEYRAGLQAKEQLAAREAREQDESADQQEAVVEEFWGHVENHFTAQLEDYPLLTAEDLPEVAQTFQSEFAAHRQALFDAFAPTATQRGLTEAQTWQVVDAKAVEWLTEAQLDAVMQRANDRYAQRLERAGRGTGRASAGGAGGSADQGGEAAAARASADAAKHNRYVDQKLAQGRDRRTVRGDTALPGTPSTPAARPDSWAGVMDDIRQTLDGARTPSQP